MAFYNRFFFKTPREIVQTFCLKRLIKCQQFDLVYSTGMYHILNNLGLPVIEIASTNEHSTSSYFIKYNSIRSI